MSNWSETGIDARGYDWQVGSPPLSSGGGSPVPQGHCINNGRICVKVVNV